MLYRSCLPCCTHKGTESGDDELSVQIYLKKKRLIGYYNRFDSMVLLGKNDCNKNKMSCLDTQKKMLKRPGKSIVQGLL